MRCVPCEILVFVTTKPVLHSSVEYLIAYFCKGICPLKMREMKHGGKRNPHRHT